MAEKYGLVKGYIKLAGYTLEQVAHELKLTRRTLDNKIKGVTDFTLPEALFIRGIVGKSIDEIFLTREDFKNSSNTN